MNRIDQVFQNLKTNNETALIPFITVGDPSLDATLDIVKQLEASGADIVELGVPYSDPLADGPVIQAATQRALSREQITLHDAMSLAVQARAEGVQMPFVLFTYYNLPLQMGLESFFKQMQEHDISGVIIPDLPFEENAQVLELSKQYNIHLIPLVAPTSEQRIQKLVADATGFVYCVSSLGVTGMRTSFHEGIEQFLSAVRSATSAPIAVGFGISNGAQVERFAPHCDGVIVGSAIVREIEKIESRLLAEDTRAEALEELGTFVATLKRK